MNRCVYRLTPAWPEPSWFLQDRFLQDSLCKTLGYDVRDGPGVPPVTEAPQGRPGMTGTMVPVGTRAYRPFVLIGVGCVVAGGLVAAGSAPAPSEHASWAAAYLVLVAGVVQVGLGAGQAMFAPRVARWLVVAQVVGWNTGNAAVLAGTLLGVTALGDVGGGLLVATLAMFVRGVGAGAAPPDLGPHRWLLRGYRLLVLIVLVSIPVGLVLARLRS